MEYTASNNILNNIIGRYFIHIQNKISWKGCESTTLQIPEILARTYYLINHLLYFDSILSIILRFTSLVLSFMKILQKYS